MLYNKTNPSWLPYVDKSVISPSMSNMINRFSLEMNWCVVVVFVQPCLHGQFRFNSLCVSGTRGTPTFLIATSVGITTCPGLGRRSALSLPESWIMIAVIQVSYFSPANTEGKSVLRWPWSVCVNCPLRADGPIYFPMIWPPDSSCPCRRWAQLPFPWCMESFMWTQRAGTLVSFF